MIRSSRCQASSRSLQTLSAAAANDFPARCQRERYVHSPLYLRPYTLSGTSFHPVCYVFSRSYYDALADRHLSFLLILNTVHGILCGSTPSLEGCREDIDGQDNEQREQQRQQAHLDAEPRDTAHPRSQPVGQRKGELRSGRPISRYGLSERDE